MFVYLISVIVLAFLIGLAVYAIIEAVKNKKHSKHTIIGGCLATRWGCCPDMVTPKYDEAGTNCIPSPQKHHIPGHLDCHTSEFGCCPDGKTPKADPQGFNC